MRFLLLLLCIGTPKSTFDCNSLKLFTSSIIKGISKMIEKKLGPEVLPWQQKIYVFFFLF